MEELIELKTVDTMPGSLNAIISKSNYLRRPPSLSESLAWTSENINRANRIPLIPISNKFVEKEEIGEDTLQNNSRTLDRIVETAAKFVLHILLISVFETLFFFIYVSTLENNGIELTVNMFITDIVNGCTNMSQYEIKIINDLLGPYINATNVIRNGNEATVVRTEYNLLLYQRAWNYVEGLSGLFVCLIIVIKWKKLNINWKVIIFENIAMVILLALYELMFFTTIVYSYHPITPDEIARNAIIKLENSCGILN